MILRATDRVLVWGITGRQATFWTEHMLACGTRVMGGVNPARAGATHLGLPVWGSGAEAGAADIALLFVPPAAALDAVRDAVRAGARTVVVLAEHVPLHDVMTMHAVAHRAGLRIVGPNTAGLVTPGEGFAGIMPGFNPRIFQPGAVGVVSRSGSLGTLVCLNLVRAGLGQSAFIGIGGDSLPGTTTAEALAALDADPNTRAIALVGEIGGRLEQEAALVARTLSKPVAAFVTGAAAPPERRMGHAGAIAEGGESGWAAKVQALEDYGVRVARTPAELTLLLTEMCR